MIHEGDKALKARWAARFNALPPAARVALREALMDLRADALRRAEYCWGRHKAPMAYYWKVVGVYAGHLGCAIRVYPEEPSADAQGCSCGRLRKLKADGGNAAPTPPQRELQ